MESQSGQIAITVATTTITKALPKEQGKTGDIPPAGGTRTIRQVKNNQVKELRLFVRVTSHRASNQPPGRCKKNYSSG